MRVYAQCAWPSTIATLYRKYACASSCDVMASTAYWCTGEGFCSELIHWLGSSSIRGAFHQAFCQCFSLTTVISYWNPCIWLAESKFVSEKHWQNALMKCPPPPPGWTVNTRQNLWIIFWRRWSRTLSCEVCLWLSCSFHNNNNNDNSYDNIINMIAINNNDSSSNDNNIITQNNENNKT